MSGPEPTVRDATTGKSYLNQQELYRIHLLSEQFLLFAESTALSGKKMTMLSLHEQLDRLLTLNNYPVFDGWKDYLKDEAESHARAELARYRKRREIEKRGGSYNEEIAAYEDL